MNRFSSYEQGFQLEYDFKQIVHVYGYQQGYYMKINLSNPNC